MVVVEGRPSPPAPPWEIDGAGEAVVLRNYAELSAMRDLTPV
jgi:hypothetical protein